MKVEMCKWTYDAEFGRLIPGRIIEIDQKTAERWIRNKIARGVTTDGGQTEQADAERYAAQREPEAAVDLEPAEATAETEAKPLTYDDFVKESVSDYSLMTKKDLIDAAKSRGVSLSSSMTKSDMIRKITENR